MPVGLASYGRGVQKFKELQEFRSLRLLIRGSGFIIFF
jgi:hypothetical protein